ncbi:MAG: aldo/keto reductase [Fusobacteriaceae bacterium]|jgi:predicted aldo/keto reductase-like oxidoreductase|nr:aldo/keto reductase [Fusobacteriaceae bacterium]
MERIRFGKTDLMVSRVGFGGIPIQRLSVTEAASVVRGVIDLGVNFLDTANAYSDSEEKIGKAIKGIKREDLVIASKSTAPDKKTFLEHLDLCLKHLGVDYVDLYQMHNISSTKLRDTVFGPDGAFEGLLEAVKIGKVRFPAFSSHNIPLAIEMMKTEKFASVQLPFNFVDDAALEEAIPLAKKLDMGFISMKPFGGGLLEDASIAIRYLLQFDNILPDPGIEKLSEMEEIVSIVNEKKPFSAEDEIIIKKLKAELGPNWCHRCDYCQPCPQGIGISAVLTVNSLIKRMPFKQAFKMANTGIEKARTCIECGDCMKRCPYKLQIPDLIKDKIALWEETLAKNAY